MRLLYNINKNFLSRKYYFYNIFKTYLETVSQNRIASWFAKVFASSDNYISFSGQLRLRHTWD